MNGRTAGLWLWAAVLACGGVVPGDETTGGSTGGSGSTADLPTTAGPGDPTTTTSPPATASTDTSTSGTSADPDTGTSTAGTTSEGSEGTTEAPLPTVETLLITDLNRHHLEMHGGWGPHLRGLMRAADDAAWFTADKGEDVLHNREILYFRRGPDEPAWAMVGAQPHADGVQQNSASILSGDVIYTYSVNTGAHLLEECYLVVSDPTTRACNTILVSGMPYMTPPNSNYVGAAVLGDGARIVWWTVVGDNGGPGAFYYTYNYGGGWNGPVPTNLATYNDIGYIHAMSTTDGTRVALVGQTFTGKYPDGFYNAVVADLTPPDPVAFVDLAGGAADVAALSTADLWIDRASGAVHVLATVTGGAVAYYHRPAAEPWAAHAQPLHVFPDSYRARFMRAGDGPLHVVRGSAGGTGVEVLRATGDAVDGAVDWATAQEFAVPSPGEGFAAPSALYVESPTYQTAAVGAVQFAMCGQYQVSDGEVWQGRLE
jgi:hypothetical protein